MKFFQIFWPILTFCLTFVIIRLNAKAQKWDGSKEEQELKEELEEELEKEGFQVKTIVLTQKESDTIIQERKYEKK